MADGLALAVGLNSIVRAGAAISGGLDQSTALQTRARLQAELLARGQAVAEQQAQDVRAQGRVKANRVRQSGKRMAGISRAALAAQGLDVNFGSALDEQLEYEKVSAVEAMTIENNAALEAYGYNSKAVDLGFQAKLAKIEGRQGSNQSLARGGLAAADEMFGSFDRYQKLKVA